MSACTRDMLALYTDGITESFDTMEMSFGESPLWIRSFATEHYRHQPRLPTSSTKSSLQSPRATR